MLFMSFYYKLEFESSETVPEQYSFKTSVAAADGLIA